jgi:hypothetical protein
MERIVAIGRRVAFAQKEERNGRKPEIDNYEQAPLHALFSRIDRQGLRRIVTQIQGRPTVQQSA